MFRNITREKIIEVCNIVDRDNTLLADGLDAAFIGVTDDGVAVYSKELCIRAIMEQDGLSDEEAIEFLEFNTFNTYVGEMTPMFINTGWD
jgi:hypothetical protein